MSVRNDPLPIMIKLPVFKGFSRSELEILASVFRLKQMKEGGLLCKEGDPGTSFYIIVAGSIRLSKKAGKSGRTELGRAGPNCLLGQKSLIDGSRREASMEAEVPSVLLECDRMAFERLFNANNTFAYKVLDFVITDLSRRLREADKPLEQMLSDPGRTLSMVVDTLSQVSGLLHDGEEFT